MKKLLLSILLVGCATTQPNKITEATDGSDPECPKVKLTADSGLVWGDKHDATILSMIKQGCLNRGHKCIESVHKTKNNHFKANCLKD